MHASNSPVRAIRVVVEGEQLVHTRVDNVRGTMEQDWKALLPAALEPATQPCYVLVRFDHPTQPGQTTDSWCLVTYAPDTAPIRQKMLLAATRATLKTQFGVAHVADELSVNVRTDATLNAWKDHLEARQDRRQAMNEVELGLDDGNGVDEAQRGAQLAQAVRTMRGLAFPVDQEALGALQRLKDGEVAYVQLVGDARCRRLTQCSRSTRSTRRSSWRRWATGCACRPRRPATTSCASRTRTRARSTPTRSCSCTACRSAAAPSRSACSTARARRRCWTPSRDWCSWCRTRRFAAA